MTVRHAKMTGFNAIRIQRENRGHSVRTCPLVDRNATAVSMGVGPSSGSGRNMARTWFGRPPNRTAFPSWMLCNGVASGSVRFPAPAIAVKTVETATRWARNWRGTHGDPEQGQGLIRCTLATEHIFSNFTDETKSPRRQGGKTGADV